MKPALYIACLCWPMLWQAFGQPSRGPTPAVTRQDGDSRLVLLLKQRADFWHGEYWVASRQALLKDSTGVAERRVRLHQLDWTLLVEIERLEAEAEAEPRSSADFIRVPCENCNGGVEVGCFLCDEGFVTEPKK